MNVAQSMAMEAVMLANRSMKLKSLHTIMNHFVMNRQRRFQFVVSFRNANTHADRPTDRLVDTRCANDNDDLHTLVQKYLHIRGNSNNYSVFY